MSDSCWGFDRFFETCRRSIDEQRLVDSLADVTTIICNASLLERFEELGLQPDVEFSEPNKLPFSWLLAALSGQ